MIRRLVQQWNWVRLLRFGIGIAAVVQGFIQKEYILLAAGGFIMGMALRNTGCCGAAGCATRLNEAGVTNLSKQKEMDYEEVDTGK